MGGADSLAAWAGHTEVVLGPAAPERGLLPEAQGWMCGLEGV